MPERTRWILTEPRGWAQKAPRAFSLLEQHLAADDARDQRGILGLVGNGAMRFLQIVVPHNPQKLRDQRLSGDPATPQGVELPVGTGGQGNGAKDL